MTMFDARTDRRLVQSRARSDRYVQVRLVAPPSLQSEARPRVNVAFVLDRSGSMGGGKIELAKEALRQALGQLAERDRFSVVFYDDKIDVVVESTAVTSEARRNALARIAMVQARGTTNLAEGWLTGADQAARHDGEQFVNRCLLLTDGLANRGITDVAELERHAGELRKRGISTTTFGVGADFDEHLLRRMANAGGGNFYFIEDPAQIPDFLTSELGEALEVVARDVRVVVEAPGDLIIESLTPVIGRERTDGVWTFGLGDLASRQEVDCVLRLNFPRGVDGHEVIARFRVEDREDAFPLDEEELGWTYADHRSNHAQERDVEVDRRVAAVFASLARTEAMLLNRSGDYDAARKKLLGVARRIRSYANGDRELERIAAALEHEAQEAIHPLMEYERKNVVFEANSMLRSRDWRGRARRRHE